MDCAQMPWVLRVLCDEMPKLRRELREGGVNATRIKTFPGRKPSPYRVTLRAF